VNLIQTNVAIRQPIQKRSHEENHHVSDNDLKYHLDPISDEDSNLFVSLFKIMTPESTPIDSPTPLCKSNPTPLINDVLVIQSLDQQITGNIKACDPTVECMLLLPHLGEVKMNVNQQENIWHINLTFMHRSALDYAKRTKPMITKRLHESLGSPVVLRLSLWEEDKNDDSSDK
jgi:hypothetical protein